MKFVTFGSAMLFALSFWASVMGMLFFYNLPTWCETPDVGGNYILTYTTLCK